MFDQIKRLLPDSIKKAIYQFKQKYITNYAIRAYSQEGEDMILARFFGNKTNGFYIDIGAHHPQRFSNTFYFYKRGWHGINIDAMPGSMTPFEKSRPRDINLEVGISNSNEELTFYCFDEPAVNSFSKELSEQRILEGIYKLQKKVKVPVYRLSKILDKYLPQGQSIDFMSIDVEGLDHEVLSSNDWQKYRPQIILLEHYDFKVEELSTDPSFVLLKNNGYVFAAKAVNTLFFKVKNI